MGVNVKLSFKDIRIHLSTLRAIEGSRVLG